MLYRSVHSAVNNLFAVNTSVYNDTCETDIDTDTFAQIFLDTVTSSRFADAGLRGVTQID